MHLLAASPVGTCLRNPAADEAGAATGHAEEPLRRFQLAVLVCPLRQLLPLPLAVLVCPLQQLLQLLLAVLFAVWQMQRLAALLLQPCQKL